MDNTELGLCLRSWRDRVQPADVGLPEQALRRAPGLRRQELAQIAGLSVDYLTRLEQGRAVHPSPQVLAALARALRLGADEHDHLFRLAGQVPPGPGRVKRHITPGIQRMLDRLSELPVTVLDASWQIVASNEMANALLSRSGAPAGREGNLVWRHFTGNPSGIVRDQDESDAFEAEVVADLHAALGRYPDDPDLRGLIDDLRVASERFAELWETRPVGVRESSRKTIRHPEVGEITVDCDVLTVHGSDLRLVVYSAAPGTADAEALALVGVLGLQRFSGR